MDIIKLNIIGFLIMYNAEVKVYPYEYIEPL